MRIATIDGRDFRDTDTNGSVAIVNEEFAKQYFDGSDPVGKTFSERGTSTTRLIVGLVRDVAYSNVRDPMLPQVYLPLRETDDNGSLKPIGFTTLVVRTSNDDPMTMAETLRRAVSQFDPVFRVRTVYTQTGLVRAQAVRERLLAALGGFFAMVALLLAAIGLYGVLHYSVVQREREIGIRIALGAAGGNIARLVTIRVFAMVMAGSVVGLALGMASVRYVASLLYGVKGTDPGMLLGPTAVLLAAAGLASLPAVMRAVRIDPVVMLRAE
jgi:predicted lysophospholipase L1 biosynthesis ABC-type transport system permease subunit